MKFYVEMLFNKIGFLLFLAIGSPFFHIYTLSDLLSESGFTRLRDFHDCWNRKIQTNTRDPENLQIL